MKKLALATLSVALVVASVMHAADQGKGAVPAAKHAPEAKVAPATTPAPSTAPATSTEPMAKKGKKHHHKKKSAEQPK